MKSNRKDKASIEKTDFGPGKTPLYYNNVGLFSDPFLEDRLPNLQKYYSHPSTSFLNEYWNIDEFDSLKFNKAFQEVMNLWNELDQDVPKYCSKERQLQNSWINKIFQILGWTLEVEETSSKHGITNYPDYALFASVEDWKRSKTLKGNYKFKKATAIADAKDWGVNLDGKGSSNKNPSYQIINYLKQTDKNWGILTDGKYWRIYSLRPESKLTTFYEIDLERILAAGDYERFKYFYNFFRSDAFIIDAKLNDRSFLDFIFEDGQLYSQRVEKNLQDRVYRVVNSICQGFLTNYPNPSNEQLKEVYEYSMYYLFRLMFVLNCESKGLLEVNKQDDYYESSLRKKCIEIKEQFEQGKNWSQQPRTYNYLNDLFNLLKTGDQSIGVHGFGKEPFEIGSVEFYSKNKIQDQFLNTALLELSCDKDEENQFQFIDYKILSPDHIGSLFEGLLEFSLIKVGKKVELINTKGDRKATGSYYTPGYLVDYIVEETLKPLIDKKNTPGILKIKVLDPSMGSGHFLLGTVKYLEKRIIEFQEENPKMEGAIEFDKIKKFVLHKCVFGIDINPLATQLAKFSLWIYSSHKGDFLEELEDQFISANTLLDSLNWEIQFKGQITPRNISAIVGNPPYIGEKGNKEIFQIVKNSSLGKRFYMGKMDYFYFFFHKTLDLLKEGGLAGLLSTNYYGTASSALKLRQDLKKRSSILKIVNFKDLKIFKGAQGQHNQVTFFSKGFNPEKKCEIFVTDKKGLCSKNILNEILNQKSNNFIQLPNKDLYEGEGLYIRANEAGQTISLIDKVLAKLSQNQKLGKICSVNQGIVSGADKVSQIHIKIFPNINCKKGDGIFIVSRKEAIEKKLNKELLKPFFKNSDIKKFSTNESSNEFIIYLDKRNVEFNSLDKNTRDHINKYYSIIEKSVCSPPYLHRPRKEKIFTGEKIVAPQRSKLNIFGYNKNKWYAASDVFFITSKGLALKPLLAYLNSKIIFVWLYLKGKRKGEALELVAKPLSEIPVIKFTKKTEQALSKLVDLILKNGSSKNLVDKIDSYIYEELKLSNSEIKAIEDFYFGKVKKTEGLDLLEVA